MLDVGTAFPHLFFSNTSLSASNKFWTKVSSARNQIFLLGNILLSLIIVLVQCTIFLKLRYRDMVAFRTKKLNEWEFGHWLTANFTFPAVTWKNIVWSFSMPLWCKCNKHLPEQSASIIIAFEFFGMFVSTRTPSIFWVRESCACFRNNIPFFDLQVIFYGQMTSKINSILFEIFCDW